MEHQKINLDLQNFLDENLWQTINGEIIEKVLQQARVSSVENRVKSIFEGHSFKVTEKLAPRLWQTLLEIRTNLNFFEPIDFYVSNTPELNAFAISKLEEHESHIINLNSGLVEKMDDEELKFVIGHEVGHLISGNARIMQIIDFVFPNRAETPVLLQNKIALWEKVSELTADRYGVLASRNFDKVISSFFKIASGLDAARINFDCTTYLSENEEILKYFEENSAGNLYSHPINPIRIKAAELFFKSTLYKSILNNKKIRNDKILNNGISSLLKILTVLSSDEIDYHRSCFVASAGIVLSSIDKAMDKEEYEQILETLASFHIFPETFLQQIIDSNDVEKIFRESTKKILEINPAERISLFEYLIQVAIIDHSIKASEVEFLQKAAVDIFGLTSKESAQIIAQVIQSNFSPSLVKY